MFLSLDGKTHGVEVYFNDEIIWITDDQRVVEAFFSEVKRIHAAGGVVRNDQGDTLWIYRFGRWDLPKGKVEGFAIQQALSRIHSYTLPDVSQELHPAYFDRLQSEAVREVREETGLLRVTPGELLETTLHMYVPPEGKPVLKITWWFAMTALVDETLLPQQEEGITDVRWFPAEELEPVIASTYASLRKVMRDARCGIRDAGYAIEK